MFALIFIVHVRCGGRRRVILLVSFISTVEFSPSAWPRYETSGVFVCPKCFPHRTWLIPDRPNWLPFKPALTISGTSFADMYQPGLNKGGLTQVQLIGKG